MGLNLKVHSNRRQPEDRGFRQLWDSTDNRRWIILESWWWWAAILEVIRVGGNGCGAHLHKDWLHAGQSVGWAALRSRCIFPRKGTVGCTSRLCICLCSRRAGLSEIGSLTTWLINCHEVLRAVTGGPRALVKLDVTHSTWRNKFPNWDLF